MSESEVKVNLYNSDGTLYDTVVYKKTEVYCPNCGKRGVFVEECDDYYYGARGYCVSCKKYHNNAGSFYKADERVISALQSYSKNNPKHDIQPRYKHDCDNCEYVGRYKIADWYICSNKDLPYHSYKQTHIFRYSSVPEDYVSGGNLLFIFNNLERILKDVH